MNETGKMGGQGTWMIFAVIAVLLCLLGAWRAPQVFLGAYLAAWWFWIGIALGGLANVWLHNLTGGQWGEALRQPLLRFSRTTWLAALLFIPVLIGIAYLFPWAAHADLGTARWVSELSAPAFKSLWLSPGFFVARSIIYLLLWSALVYLSQLPRFVRSQPFSAVALIVYGFSVSLASVDWIVSLMPLWYSSVFGWMVGAGQMLSGLALGIALAAFASRRPPSTIFRDFGNLLLMYVLSWTYLAFSQFLIIWSENLPHEIAWYLPRSQGVWLIVAWMLVLFFLCVPVLILLSRQAKQTPRLMGWLGVAMLVLQLLNTCWLILPSLPVAPVHWLWALPLVVITFLAVGGLAWRRLFAHAAEVRHA